MARGELGPRAHRRRVVGAPRPGGLGRARPADERLRQGPRPQRRRARADRDRRLRRRSARRPGSGLLLAAPTIATHGTQEQIDLYVRDIVTGAKAWCQLFSEPGAGSDLAGLTTRAVKDGDEWVVNGQKVWTSVGQIADMGMLIARTDPDVPKHQGITLLRHRHAPGRASRSARCVEMTGHAMFNEVFLNEAHVPRRRHHRRPQQRLGGGQHHAHARARRPRRRRRVGRRRRWPRPARSPTSSTRGPATSCRSAAPRGVAGAAPAAGFGGAGQACSSTWPRATARSTTRRSART